MVISPRGDGCQVRDRENLLTATDFTKTLPDLLGDLTTETRVNLVEDRHHVRARRLERDRQEDAAQLSATGERREGTLWLTWVRCEENLRVRSVDTVDDETQCRVRECHAGQLASNSVGEMGGGALAFLAHTTRLHGFTLLQGAYLLVKAVESIRFNQKSVVLGLELSAHEQCGLEGTAVLTRYLLEDVRPRVKVVENLRIEGVRVTECRKFTKRLARLNERTSKRVAHGVKGRTVRQTAQCSRELAQHGLVPLRVKQLENLIERVLSFAERRETSELYEGVVELRSRANRCAIELSNLKSEELDLT